MFCRECGNPMEADSNFCTKCGRAVVSVAVSPPPLFTPKVLREFLQDSRQLYVYFSVFGGFVVISTIIFLVLL